MGLLLGIIISSVFMQKHVDVMRKLTYAIAEDAYYSGCRDSGGESENCHTMASNFLPKF